MIPGGLAYSVPGSRFSSLVPATLTILRVNPIFHSTLGILPSDLVATFNASAYISSIDLRPHNFLFREDDFSFKASSCDHHHRDARHWEIYPCSNAGGRVANPVKKYQRWRMGKGERLI